MIKDRELQRVRGAAAEGMGWSTKAATTLTSAEELVEADPNSAYTLAYDAARFACAGLLAQQGLRPTTSGGHYAIHVETVCGHG